MHLRPSAANNRFCCILIPTMPLTRRAFAALSLSPLLSKISTADERSVNPKVAKIAAEVSEDRIKAIIAKLVTFETRNTMSDATIRPAASERPASGSPGMQPTARASRSPSISTASRNRASASSRTSISGTSSPSSPARSTRDPGLRQRPLRHPQPRHAPARTGRRTRQ